MATHELPEWLIAEDHACTRWFIMHTCSPRFIAEIFDDEETGGNIFGSPAGEIIWLDEPPLNPQRAARLMRRAGDALARYDDLNEIEAERSRQDDETD